MYRGQHLNQRLAVLVHIDCWVVIQQMETGCTGDWLQRFVALLWCGGLCSFWQWLLFGGLWCDLVAAPE
jgi:hypothetical protein